MDMILNRLWRLCNMNKFFLSGWTILHPPSESKIFKSVCARTVLHRLSGKSVKIHCYNKNYYSDNQLLLTKLG